MFNFTNLFPFFVFLFPVVWNFFGIDESLTVFYMPWSALWTILAICILFVYSVLAFLKFFAQKKNRNGRDFFRPFVPIALKVLLLSWIGVSRSYVPAENKEFLSRLSGQIVNPVGEIQIKDLTDFQWDEVCVLYRPSLTAHALQTEDFINERGVDLAYKTSLISRIVLMREIEYRLAFIFISERSAGRNIRLRKPIVFIEGKAHQILTHGVDENSYKCLSDTSALFTYELTDRKLNINFK